MGTAPPIEPRQVGILVMDDPASSVAVRQLLDSEAWRVRIVPDTEILLSELKSGDWSLVIANIVLTVMNSAAFVTLRELSSVSQEEGGRIRVLFVIPEMAGTEYAAALDQARLPYVARPYHFHEFLDKVSDLLVEVKAIDSPIRQLGHEFGGLRKKKKQVGRATSMFASRDSVSYTEEEIAEYERQESETSKARRGRTLTNLGDPNR